jgi:hypothetical protein
MSVAFPSGYNLERSSVFTRDNNVRVDFMDDGSQRVRVLGPDQWTTIECQFAYLTQSEKDTLVTFANTNRAEQITWTIDGTDYIGRIISPVQENMTGNRYSVSFTFRAKEV